MVSKYLFWFKELQPPIKMGCPDKINLNTAMKHLFLVFLGDIAQKQMNYTLTVI